MARRPSKVTAPGNDLSTPMQEQIAALANALWRERGCPDGSPEADWFQAERELERKTEIVKAVRRARAR